MKTTTLLALVTAATMSTLFAAEAHAAADRRNFWLLNETGRTISEVHLAAHGSREPWGDDILVGADLPNGLGTKIVFLSGSACVTDFRVVYTDGTSEDYLEGRNLCVASAIEFIHGGYNMAFVIGRS